MISPSGVVRLPPQPVELPSQESSKPDQKDNVMRNLIHNTNKI